MSKATLNTLEALNQATYGISLNRPAAVFTGASATPIFNVVGGRVAVRSIVGQITVAASGATNISLQSNPTVGTTSLMCAVLAAAGLEVATLLTINGDIGTAMWGVNAGAGEGQLQDSILPLGQIEFVLSAAQTISVGWTVNYVPVDTGAYLTVV